MSTTLALAFVAATTTFNLPPGLLSAVCHVESSHDVQAYNPSDGGTSSIGVCQIKLGTARLLGFKGLSEALRRPDVNAYYAGAYLHSQLSRYHGDIPKAISAYNAGTCRLNEKGLIKNRKYVEKVFRAWGAH